MIEVWYGVRNGLVRRKIWVRIWTESECIVRGCILQFHTNLDSIVRSVMELVIYVLGDPGICSYFLKKSSVQSTSTWVAGFDRSKPGKSTVSCLTEQVRRNRTRLMGSIMY